LFNRPLFVYLSFGNIFYHLISIMEQDQNSETIKPKGRKILRNILFAFLGLWAVILIALQVVLNSKVLTKIVNNIAAEYVDGDISFGKINASVFKSFPNLNVTIDNVSLTYPHDRFAEFDSVGIRSQINPFGRNELADTLASFKKLSASVNYLALPFGKIKVPKAILDRPRVFAHQYDSTTANWNMFILPETEEEEETALSIPPIVLGHVGLTSRPEVYYTNPTDTLFAAMYMNELTLKGRIATRNTSKNKIKLDIENFFATCRLPVDTVTVNLNHFMIDEHKDHMDVEADANAILATSSFGKMTIPVELFGELSFKESEGIAFGVKDLKLDVATVELTGEADVEILDSIYVKGNASIDKTPVADLINFFGDNFPQAKNVSTNAKLSIGVNCDGWYNPSRGTLPVIEAFVKIPESDIKYEGLGDKGTLGLDLIASSGADGKFGATLNDLTLDFCGIDFGLKGKAIDLLGEDPLFGLDGNGHISLPKIATLLPEDMDITLNGEIDVKVDGDIYLSEMTPYNFSKSDFKAELKSNLISVQYTDSISAYLQKPSITMDKGIVVKLDSLNADIYTMQAGATDAYFFIENAVEQMGDDASKHPLMGDLDVSSINVKLDEETTAGIRNTCDIFTFTQKKTKNVLTPILSFSTKNDKIFAHSGVNRVTLDNANFDVRAAMHTFEKNQKKRHAIDSLKREHPGVPKDELLEKARRGRDDRDIPDYMQEKEFNAQDFNLKLDESLAKYYREWDLSGHLDIKEGLLITPYFPLKNELRNIKGSFTNDQINLSNFTIAPGESDLSASGTLSNLKRAFLNGRPVDLKLEITSNSINANELIGAYDAGSRYVEPAKTSAASLDDEQYLSAVTDESLTNTTVGEMALLVVPANIRANVSLQCNSIDYSSLNINWLAADLVMKERCIQLTNTLATTNMGDLYFEGFYSTKSKKNIAAGFDITMSDISADQVIDLMPAVDTIMPMIKAFKGMLDCEMAVTTQLDTNMSFIIPSMNGIVKINGQQLSLEETGPIKTLAKVLMFKNKKTGYIDDMNMNGILKDNTLEVFPFVLKIDRYTLAMSGLQDMDNDFKYHISVLKSPIPFRFGINLFGNFDDWKWRIGRAKYKSANIPVFTAQVDSLKDNLVHSIHNVFTKGVDKVMADNQASQDAISARKAELGYDPNAPMDSLDVSELAQLDSLQRDYENPVDSLMNARIDSLSKVAAINEAMEGVVVDEYEGTKIQQMMDEKFDKQEAKEAQKLSKKQLRQQRREARRAARAKRRAARLARRNAIVTDTVKLSWNDNYLWKEELI